MQNQLNKITPKKYNFKVTHTVRNKRVQGVISSEDKDFSSFNIRYQIEKKAL